MKCIDDKSIDMILCDLPYGVTACNWDKQIPLDKLWEQYKRIIKENGAILLFSSQPFTTDLIESNRKWFKYCWYWIKNQGTNFFHAKRMPIRKIEEICVFYKKQPTYNLQMSEGIYQQIVLKGVVMVKFIMVKIGAIMKVDQR